MTMPPMDSETLRGLVRDVLAELLPAAFAPGAHSSTPSEPAPPLPAPEPIHAPGPSRRAQEGAPLPGAGSVQMVTLRTDDDLAKFVGRLLHLFENPKHREELRAGRLRFRLSPGGTPDSHQPAHRVDKGAVTEAMVRKAAQTGARLVLGPRAVLTPLAKDRARAANVEIVRER